MGFDINGFDSLEKALETASKRFPASVENVLTEEAKNVSQDAGDTVAAKIKGHGKKPGTLQKGFKPGKVIKKGNNYTSASVTGAPHYHLVEEGHDLYTHLKKNKRGKGKVGSNKKIGHVEGKKIVAQVMAKRTEYSELIAMELLDSILKEAGFDD